MVTEAQMLEQFSNGYDFPPAFFRLSNLAIQRADRQIDAILDATVDGETFQFGAEFRSRNSPKLFEETVLRIENSKVSFGRLPLLVVPFLRESQLQSLQERKLSGLDLSGNGVISVPGRILIFRSGSPNKFPDSVPSKYVYRGATSLVARVFLCSKDAIKLLQPEKLLESLASSYSPPKTTQTISLASKATFEELFSGSNGLLPMVLTGQSSIKAYAVMGSTDVPKLYVQSTARLLKEWGNRVEQTSRFIELELVQTDDPTVYFDSRLKNGIPYASPVQAFLEASSGDKRERETAINLRNNILNELNQR